ncbi:MAG: SH3 domain-containing protein, partial [Chloroflexi bacterium]|nr:SH3 domain-containing protein [Chloroflexota bacterium]
RTDVRSFPTAEVITSEPFQFDFDRIQETTIDTGTPVAVTAVSSDGEWAFCLTPFYWGWVRAEHITFGTREQVAEYANAAPFVMTTASRGTVALVAGGTVCTQMGTRLPLREEKNHAYRVGVPTRKLDGSLRISDGFIAKRQEHFTPGVLPCTRQTIFTQAFSLLGEPYAWGDSRMGLFGRDCSRLIRDIHAVTGIILPRNADQQEKVCAPVVLFYANMSDDERKSLLADRVPPGAVLAMPGHIMLYLGHVNGEPYVIHDTSANGFSSVIVSDLSLGATSPAGSLLQRLTTAVMIG